MNYLVESDEQEVLMLWQGVGYYSWPRRLHKTSKLLVQIIGKNNISDPSCWPVDVKTWMNFLGIGKKYRRKHYFIFI